ncbi:unnamed protein product [Camellia sinensis]
MLLLILLIAKEHGGIMRFIQVSCLGASSSSPSRMLRAKAAAEEAIMREIPEATILRPAVMIGTEDRILNRWAQFAKNYGFLPLIGDGSTKKLQLCPNLVDIFLKGLYCRIQPVYVVDVASAIVTALNDDCTSMGKVFELGGPEVFTVHELAELMYDMIREWPRYVKVPFPIAKMWFHLSLRGHMSVGTGFRYSTISCAFTPLISLVGFAALTFDDLSIMPHKLKGYPVEFLIQYRKGGPQYGSTVSKKVISSCMVIQRIKLCEVGKSTMKNFWGCKQEEEAATINLLKLISHLMSGQSGYGSFERVNLEGKNVGAAMINRRGTSGESPNCCNINIYINNNIQGVNNSVLVGSEVKMGDPGVCLSLSDVKLGKAFLEPKKKSSNLGFYGMLLLVAIAIFLLRSLF